MHRVNESMPALRGRDDPSTGQCRPCAGMTTLAATAADPVSGPFPVRDERGIRHWSRRGWRRCWCAR
ncbi:hypothetical protein BZL30_2334 [Mycobacterium kansasii]|uniref:Uncharacterized protein n=1 Tax=Mycobacterium kansasii TaxID=1768 RepID=A0A1V3XIN0_MYCKA|nr:hypothetical protein BZL30_2334 [Mycobacterium kansasii]